MSEPENPAVAVNEISTGYRQDSSLMHKRDYFFGIVSWVAWFSWGIYLWWFTATPMFEYAVGVVVWVSVFLFSIIGVPIVRRVARDRVSKHA